MTDRIFALVLASLIIGVLGLGQWVDHYRWGVVRMPLIMGGLSAVLLLIIALAPRKPPPAEPEAQEGTTHAMQVPDLRRDLRGMIQVALALPALWLFGFVAGPGLYSLAIVRYHKHSWGMAIVMGLATSAIAYVLFRQILSVRIPLGPLIGL